MPFFIITTPSQPGNPSSYTLVTTAPNCAPPKNHLCYIIAADNGIGQPVITNDLLIEIITALNSKTESLSVKLKP